MRGKKEKIFLCWQNVRGEIFVKIENREGNIQRKRERGR